MNPNLPENTYCLFFLWKQWQCVAKDFSPGLDDGISGSGDTPQEAILNYQDNMIADLKKQIEAMK